MWQGSLCLAHGCIGLTDLLFFLLQVKSPVAVGTPDYISPEILCVSIAVDLGLYCEICDAILKQDGCSQKIQAYPCVRSTSSTCTLCVVQVTQPTVVKTGFVEEISV